jgi:hypothetical protein
MASQRLMPIYVWLYCLVWWFIQDWIKCGCYVWMDRFDVFSYRTFMDPDTPAVAPHATIQRPPNHLANEEDRLLGK